MSKTTKCSLKIKNKIFIKNITTKDVIYVGSQTKTENGIDMIFEADFKEYQSKSEKTEERSNV